MLDAVRGSRFRAGGRPGGHDKVACCSDEDLLTGAATDPEQFGEFFDRHYDNLSAYFAARVSSVDNAADLCAETFTAALENTSRFDPTLGTASQWLYGIARNKLFGYWRNLRVDTAARDRLQIRAVPVDDATASFLRAEASADRARVLGALEQLPEDQRAAVWLRVVNELDYDDIAARLACRPGAARVRVHRGLRRLRDVLDTPDVRR